MEINMKYLEINNTQLLDGTVKVPGSKNSALGLIAASCLGSGPITLENIPYISDVKVLCDICKSIGMKVSHNDNLLSIDPSEIYSSEIDTEKSSNFRTAYYFAGSLLAKFKKVTIGFPGGDNLGPRPIDQHIKGFMALGAKFEFFDNYYIVEAERLTGADIYFDVITSGATINLMLAASLAKGKTVLHNAAHDPEVVDIAIFLNKMGAKIFGAGTDTIRIEGVDELGVCTHQVIPDRLIAGSFLISAGITNGKIIVDDIIPEHLEACIDKLIEIGMNIETKDNSITAYGGSQIKASRIRTGMYPVFATDLQQPLTALLLKANGRSTISDKIYPHRFNHCEQLKRMGADITVKQGIARINTFNPLRGAWVHAQDIRAGTCLILAAMMAEGTTYITGVEHIERGYEDIVATYSSLGANIKLYHENDEYGRIHGKSILEKG